MNRKRILIFACAFGALCFTVGGLISDRHSRGGLSPNVLIGEQRESHNGTSKNQNTDPKKEMSVWVMREGGAKLRAGEFESTRRAVRLAEFFGSEKEAAALKNLSAAKLAALVKKLEGERQTAGVLRDERAFMRTEMLLGRMRGNKEAEDEGVPEK